MKLTLLFLIISCTFAFANAQIISFNDQEINSLKQLLKKNDPLATSAITKWQSLADNAFHDSPNPVDTIFSQGILANQPNRIASRQSLLDIDKTYSLAICYRINGQKSYLQKAQDYLLAWATVNHPQGNAINETKLDGLLEAYDLLKGFLSTDAKQTITQWLQTLAQLERNRNPSNNNFNSHRLKIYGQIAFLLGDTAMQQQAMNELTTHISNNLLPDSTSFDLQHRDAFHYHIYTLTPMLTLATSIKRAYHKDLYHYVSPTGSSISYSVAYMLPYINGKKTHAEFVHTTVTFDKERANNHERGFQSGKLFKPETARVVIAQAQYFDPKLSVNIQLDEWQLLTNQLRQ